LVVPALAVAGVEEALVVTVAGTVVDGAPGPLVLPASVVGLVPVVLGAVPKCVVVVVLTGAPVRGGLVAFGVPPVVEAPGAGAAAVVPVSTVVVVEVEEVVPLGTGMVTGTVVVTRRGGPVGAGAVVCPVVGALVGAVDGRPVTSVVVVVLGAVDATGTVDGGAVVAVVPVVEGAPGVVVVDELVVGTVVVAAAGKVVVVVVLVVVVVVVVELLDDDVVDAGSVVEEVEVLVVVLATGSVVVVAAAGRVGDVVSAAASVMRPGTGTMAKTIDSVPPKAAAPDQAARRLRFLGGMANGHQRSEGIAPARLKARRPQNILALWSVVAPERPGQSIRWTDAVPAHGWRRPPSSQ
jgi:hypothetical protein